MSSGQKQRLKQKIKGSKKESSISYKAIPTRRDSVVSAYHHNHMAKKTKNYADPYYDAAKSRAKKVAKKFPKLDAYMRVKSNRSKMGFDY